MTEHEGLEPQVDFGILEEAVLPYDPARALESLRERMQAGSISATEGLGFAVAIGMIEE